MSFIFVAKSSFRKCSRSPRRSGPVLDDAKVALALAGLSAAEAEQFSTLARLRNLLAHEYLDLLYDRIRTFLDSFPHAYDRAIEFLEAFLREP
jgi:uncharacterized protein YutE (UPF0331/DUF86 family)